MYSITLCLSDTTESGNLVAASTFGTNPPNKNTAKNKICQLNRSNKEWAHDKSSAHLKGHLLFMYNSDC